MTCLLKRICNLMLEWKNFEIAKSSYIKEDKELLDFQQYTVFQALAQRSYLAGLATGAGKTVTSLATYFYYKEKYPLTKLIIITNKSAIFQFNSEIDKFFNYSKERLIIHSDMAANYKKARTDSISEFLNNAEKEILIMNYPVLKIDIESIINCVITYRKKSSLHRIFCIYDEATAFKNTSTSTYKSVIKLSMHLDKIIALSATITKGKLEEAYGIFRGIGISITKNKSQFIEKYCITKKIPRFNLTQIIGYKNISDFKKAISPYSITLNKSDIADSLPSFTSSITYLECDDFQKSTLQQIKNGDFLKEDSSALNNNMLIKMLEFGYNRRCLIDPNIVHLDENKVLEYQSPKTKEILRLLEDDYSSEKLVIYCQSKKYVDILEKTISSKCKNTNYSKVLKITGDISTLDRENYKNLFSESSEYNIIILNKAGIESINLQIANTLIVCNICESGGDLIQLLGRISRIGSKHSNLYVNYLLMDKTQDVVEYFVINKQLLLLKSVLGESEKGIIDYDILKKDSSLKNISDEEFSSGSIDKILYSASLKSNII